MIYYSKGYHSVLLCSILAANLALIGCASERQVSQQREDRERVEIGYGSAEKERVTGSISTLEAGDMNAENAVSVADMLRGRVSGVDVIETPGGGIQLRIRGTHSMMGSSEPLIVLDGFALQSRDGVLYDINPRDIESITVLKDVASTAIYGVRGANGVIVIKTKLGR